MSITNLLRQDGETLEQYRARFYVSTSLSPDFVIDNAQAEKVIHDVVGDDNEALRRLMLDHVLNGGIQEDFLSIFLVGLAMVYNPIQLIRFKEAMELQESTKRILEEDGGTLDQILEAQMYVLRDKSQRAAKLVEEYEGMDESPFNDSRMSNHWVGTKDLAALKQVGIALLESKAKAISGLRGLQDTLSKIADIERRKRN